MDQTPPTPLSPSGTDPCPSCDHGVHMLLLCDHPSARPGGQCGCPGAAGSAAAKLMEQLDPDAALRWHRATMGLNEALERFDRFMAVGRAGWADPGFLAALERVRAAAAQVAIDERDVTDADGPR